MDPVNKGPVDPEAVKKKMWLDYQYAHRDRENEVLDALHKLVALTRDPSVDLHRTMQAAADTIREKLWIREVTIGLMDPSEGMYRYEVQAGFTDSAWEALRQLKYSYEQFVDPELYKAKQISKYTRLFLQEDNPFAPGEEVTYDWTVIPCMERRSLDDTLLADYLDINIYGPNEELLGWIEISGTIAGKLPDPFTIKTVELIASIIGTAIMCKRVLPRMY
ncbi:MAG: hypothetical protein ACUVT7_00615 [Thermoplasmata archaeon]